MRQVATQPRVLDTAEMFGADATLDKPFTGAELLAAGEAVVGDGAIDGGAPV
jgi:hypothetical protein